MDRVKLSVEQMKSLRGIADGKPAFLFDGERQVGQLLYLLDTAIKASLPEGLAKEARALLEEGAAGFGRVLVATSDQAAVSNWTKRCRAYLDSLKEKA